MPIGGYGGRGGGGGGGNLTLVHSPAVSPAVERLGNVPGQIRGTVVIDISDITAFTAITTGTLTIGGVTVAGIDLSGATTINEVVNTISAAVQAEAQLGATYTVSLDYINPNFYGRIIRDDGDVPAVSGTIEPLFGWAAPASTQAHVARSPYIVLPAAPGGGNWTHLAIRALGQSYRTQYWHFLSDFWSVDSGNLANYLAFNNSNGWETSSFAVVGEIQVGAVIAYNVAYFNVLYNPDTRTLSWQPARAQPPQTSWVPSIETLQVMGR